MSAPTARRGPPPPPPPVELPAEEDLHASFATLGVDPNPLKWGENQRRMLTQVAEGLRSRAADYLEELPAFPAAAAEIFKEAERPEVDLQQLVRVVSSDPSISLELVRIANSAFSASAMEIKSVRDAVVRLGSRQSARIAAGLAAQTLFDVETRRLQQQHAEAWTWLREHCTTTGFAAAAISAELHQGDPGKCFLGGLFHDLGMAPALLALGDMSTSGEAPLDLEREQVLTLLDAVHVELGGMVAVQLELPEFLVECALLHHGGEIPAGRPDIHVVRIASTLDCLLGQVPPRASAVAELESSLRALNITAKAVVGLGKTVRGSKGKLG